MIINENLIDLHAHYTDKKDAISKLIALAKQDGRINDTVVYFDAVMHREAEASTSLGYSVAIPHSQCDEVCEPFVAMARCEEEMLWNDKMVRLIFLIGVPKSSQDNLHLKILANLSKHLIEDEFREELLKTNDIDKMLKIFSEF